MSPKSSWPLDIFQMHRKFGVHATVSALPSMKLYEFLKFQLRFLEEELTEAKSAKTAEDIVDAMIDLCVVAIGTLDAFGVDAQRAWDCVYLANMAKQPGVKETRPNPFGFPDLIKPPGWKPPEHKNNTGLLAKIL